MRAFAKRFRTFPWLIAHPPEADLDRRAYVRMVRRITVLLVVVGLAARLVRFVVGAALWGDEVAIGLNVVTRDFEGLTRPLDWMQVAPVLFLWAERAVVLGFGACEWSLRLLPFLAGAGGLLLFWDFARRVVPPTAAALAVGVLAVGRWPVYLSGTAKPYSGDLFWSAVLVTLAARWRQRPDRLWPLALLSVVVPVALGSSYPTVFVAGAVVLYLLPAVWRHQDRRAAWLLAAYSVLMVASFAAAYILVAGQKADPRGSDIDKFMMEYWAHGFPPADPVGFLTWVVKAHTGRMFAFPIGDGNGGSTIVFLVFALGAWRCWRTGQRAILVLCLVPFGLNFVAAVAQKYPYGGCCRLSQHLAPAICLLTGVGWAALLDRAPRVRVRAMWVASGALGLGVFAFGQMAFDLYRPHHDPMAEWSQWLGRELGRQVRPDDLVIVRKLTPQKEATVEWCVTRLGARVTREETPVPAPETRRVWVIVLSRDTCGPLEVTRLTTALGPAWGAVARADYTVRPDPKDPTVLSCSVVCFARAGAPEDRPVLHAWP
ncbi:MAG: hypothetical protein JWO38_7792 [Gemmataceae bacterium]|nr:hypothetical protein [Gemmataceae bacterium]